jgi:hypothetical protein
MKALLNLTEAIRAELEGNELINSVSFGDMSDVDLDKQSMFPMAHISLSTAQIGSATSTLGVSILFLDVVDETKERDEFYKSNEQFIWNSMLAAATKTVQELKRGDLYANLYQVEEDVTAEFFSERFEDKLAGVGLDMSVTIVNNIDLC